jgi:hypothetical protein
MMVGMTGSGKGTFKVEDLREINRRGRFASPLSKFRKEGLKNG